MTPFAARIEPGLLPRQSARPGILRLCILGAVLASSALATPHISTTSLPDGSTGAAYHAALAATGGPKPFTWSVSSGALPNGLALASSGDISGSPTAAQTSTFTAKVTASDGTTDSKSLQIAVQDPPPAPLTVTTSSLPNGAVGAAYNQSLSASGGSGSYSWSINKGSLPGGLSLSAGGSITGTPTATGTSNFTVEVKDSSNATATKPLSITVADPPLTVTTSSLPNGTVGTAYNQSLSASGGSGSYSWSITSGSLPAGLSLSAGGSITGTPTTAATSKFTVQVKDGANNTDSKPLSIAVSNPPLTVTTASLPDGTAGTAYNQSLSASGGSGSYSWSITSGSLPAGLSLSAGGFITGTPTTAATSNFTVQVKDSSNATATKPLSITIADPPLTVTTSSLPNGTVGVAYNQSLSASGGSGSYSWSLTSGSLPAGLSLSAGGAISGTPTTAATSNFTVQVKDSANNTNSKPLSITIANPALTVTTSSLPNGTVGVAYNQSLSASGGSGSYSWSLTSGSLPAGLSLSAAGAITGTPTTAATSNFTVQVKDSSNATATQPLSITVANPPLTITTSSLPNGTVGVAYNQSLAASGGFGSYSWSITSGSLPAGLSLSASGSISGTPTAAATSNFTVQVKDSAGNTATQPLSITIANPPLTVTTSALPNGVVGAAYTQSLSASGGSGSYSWSVTSGSLPAGLSLSAGGAITGTPTAAATSNFTVQVKDSSNATATQPLSITINNPPLTVTTSALPNGVVGAAYTQSLSASGGSGSYSWSITSGSLPAGLSLSASGAISGTPTTAATSNFTVQVKDSSNSTATQPLSITINNPPLTITTSALPNGIVGAAYTQSLSASGGSGSYSWSVTSGSLPAGLSLSATGSISGTPTTAATSNFTVQVKDSSNSTATQALSIAIAPPGLAITTSALAAGTVGTAYTQSLSASGGTGSYSWSLTSGSLPAGLSLSASGSISGTPTAAGTSNFTVQVKDSSGATATQALNITVNYPPLTVTTSSLPAGTVGVAYSQSLNAGGGSGSYSWSITSGSLPAGLSLSASGSISGTPTAAGTANFTVQVKDASNTTVAAALAISIAAPPLNITTATLPNGVVGTPYSQSLSATGGSGSFSWSIAGGSLPAGLSLSRAGLLSGTPTTPGPFSFTASVTDGSATAKANFSLFIASTITLPPPSLPTGIAGSAYTGQLNAAGGVPPYFWTLTSGQLPAGLALDPPTGSITGTPTVAGTFDFSAQVTDSALGKASGSFTITVNPALSVTPTATAALATGSAGAHYSQTFVAKGGIAPYTWSLSGTLPNGLTFSAGVLSGAPTQVGTFPITVQVTDTTSTKVTAAYSLQVVSGLAIATPPVLPAATSGVAYSFTLQPVGGSSPYSWTVIAGSLPGGLTFSGTGQISGTPVSIGTFTFTAQVTDANSNTAQKQLSLTVSGPLTITTTTLLAGNTGASYSQTLTAVGGAAPYLWSITAGSLPPGVTLESPTGTLSGIPTATGTFTFTATVTDSNSVAAQKQFQIVIGAGLTVTSAASLPAAMAGSSYTFQMQASGGRSPYTWSISQGSLPPGLSLDAVSGVISGAPSAAGTFNFTIQVTDSVNAIATRVTSIVVALPQLPAISINGLPGSLQTLQQPLIDISIASPYPVAVTGTVSLAFAPADSNSPDDPSVQFSTGGRSATFTIPANATHATFGAPQFAVQTGSVMGSITLTIVSLQAAGTSLNVPPSTAQTGAIAAAPPVINSLMLTHTSTGIQLQIVALTDTRELTQATITFQPASGDVLQNQTLTIPLSAVASSWFQGASSAPYGGQFGLTLPFTFQGTVTLNSVSVVLSNSKGDSQAASANY